MTIGDLALDTLEGGEAEVWLRDFETFFERGAGFVLDHEELAVRFVMDKFLDRPEMVGRAEEGAPGEVCDGNDGCRWWCGLVGIRLGVAGASVRRLKFYGFVAGGVRVVGDGGGVVM